MTDMRQLARSSTRYGYFVVPDRRTDDPHVWVACPTCRARVNAWVPSGKRGAHAEVKALHEAVLAHLQELGYDMGTATGATATKEHTMMIATARIADIVLKATAAYDKKAASAATLAAGTPHAMAWAEFANQLAELEGEVYACSRILNACGAAVEVPQSFMYEVAMEMLSDGADDGWSGRTNDARRARFDGVRTACGTLRWMM